MEIGYREGIEVSVRDWKNRAEVGNVLRSPFLRYGRPPVPDLF